MSRAGRDGRRRWGLAGLVAGALAAASPAWAGEGESALSFSVGYASYAVEVGEQSISPDGGGGVAVTYERGISEEFSWRLSGGGALYLDDDLGGGGWASGGLVYRFDVLKYVPYAALTVGGSLVGGGDLADLAAAPVVELAGGLDVLISRERSWGVEARVASFAGDSTLVLVGLRMTRRWGFF